MHGARDQYGAAMNRALSRTRFWRGLAIAIVALVLAPAYPAMPATLPRRRLRPVPTTR